MSRRKYMLVTLGFVLSVSLFASLVTAMLVSCYDGRRQFELLNAVCGEALEQEPRLRVMISSALKEYVDGAAKISAENDE